MGVGSKAKLVFGQLLEVLGNVTSRVSITCDGSMLTFLGRYPREMGQLLEFRK